MRPSFAAGIREWSDHQAKRLPFLRTRTARSVQVPEAPKDRAIVFVEPRCHPATEFVLRNLRYFCSWDIVIVHGTENESFMRKITNEICGSFTFLNSKIADLPNPAYNTLFTSPDFWKAIGREWVLITQTDTMLMRKADDELNSYIERKIPFLGAPWNYSCNLCQAPLDAGCGHMIDQRVVASLGPAMIGNGGFSFRNVPVMLQCLAQYRLEPVPVADVAKHWNTGTQATKLVQSGCTNEDVFFNKCIQELKIENTAKRLDGLRFAIEQLGPIEWPSAGAVALGCHKPWVYLPSLLTRAILARAEYEL